MSIAEKDVLLVFNCMAASTFVIIISILGLYCNCKFVIKSFSLQSLSWNSFFAAQSCLFQLCPFVVVSIFYLQFCQINSRQAKYDYYI